MRAAKPYVEAAQEMRKKRPGVLNRIWGFAFTVPHFLRWSKLQEGFHVPRDEAFDMTIDCLA